MVDDLKIPSQTEFAQRHTQKLLVDWMDGLDPTKKLVLPKHVAKKQHLFVAFSAEDNEGGAGGKRESKDEYKGQQEPQTGVQVSEERSKSDLNSLFPQKWENLLGPPIVGF